MNIKKELTLTDRMLDMIRSTADKQGITESEYIRRAIAEALVRDGNPTPTAPGRGVSARSSNPVKLSMTAAKKRAQAILSELAHDPAHALVVKARESARRAIAAHYVRNVRDHLEDSEQALSEYRLAQVCQGK